MNEIEKLHDRVNFCLDRINTLEEFIMEQTMVPKMRILILDTLQRNQNITEKKLWKMIKEEELHGITMSGDYKAKLHFYFYISFYRMEKEKVLVPESHGRGHLRTWKSLSWEKWKENNGSK